MPNMKRARSLSHHLQPAFKLNKLRPATFHQNHIVNYNAKHLFFYGFINPMGSTFSWFTLVRTAIMCGVATIASQFRCKTVPNGYSFCFPVLSDTQGLIFASLVAFLLGMFVTSTFTRWWSCREKLGVIMNNTSLMALAITNYLPTDLPSQEIGKKLLRWMHLAHCLVYKQANEDYTFGDLVAAEVATEEEVERLSSMTGVSLPGVVYGWCMHAVRALIVDHKLNPVTIVNSSVAYIQNCFIAAQELAAFINTQVPYAYLHLIALTTKVHLAFIVFYGGGIISGGLEAEQWTRVLFGYVIIVTNNFIYEGLLHIHAMLSNPLGDDDGDFPTHLYVSNTISMCSAFETAPPVSAAKAAPGQERTEKPMQVVVEISK